MPATLPTVRGGAVGLYPLDRSTLITTRVQRFLNASEQRFKSHAALERFQLVYRRLLTADRNALKSFYATTKAAFDSTWSFTIASTYTTCTFLDDGFSSVETSPNLYDVTLRFRQVMPGGAPTAAGSSYPTLSTGATAQRPFTEVVRYRTTYNDVPSGMRYAYAWYGSGLTNFPARGLMGWTLEYPSVSDADMAALEEFFVAMNGRWQTFSFTDPEDNVTYTSVRFDQDSFAYRYLDNNHASTTVQLIETN